MLTIQKKDCSTFFPLAEYFPDAITSYEPSTLDSIPAMITTSSIL